MKNNAQKTHRLIVPVSCKDKRLDQALVTLLPEYSRTQLQHWIDQNKVLVNGKYIKAKSKINGGENIQIEAQMKVQPQWVAQDIPLHIVYEDEAILIINKPIGLVVHPGAGNPDQTLLNALLYCNPQLQSLPRAGILHRLDKDTSGLMVVAKTQQAVKALTMQIKKRTLLREYQAIVYGRLISGGTIDAPLARHSFQRKQMAVIETGKKAITHYRISEKFRAHTRLIVRLETGRTHQIRVHMSHIHHPIVGDLTYGARARLNKGMTTALIQLIQKFEHQALHAFALGLSHPITHEWMRWEIDLPEDMMQLIRALREDTNLCNTSKQTGQHPYK